MKETLNQWTIRPPSSEKHRALPICTLKLLIYTIDRLWKPLDVVDLHHQMSAPSICTITRPSTPSSSICTIINFVSTVVTSANLHKNYTWFEFFDLIYDLNKFLVWMSFWVLIGSMDALLMEKMVMIHFGGRGDGDLL